MTVIIDIWWRNLDQVDPSAIESLSPSEIQYYNQIILPQQRQRQLLSRACLRHVLTQYLEMEAELIPLLRQLNGKPVLGLNNPPINFNISHSGNWFVCAIAPYPVGVDIEAKRPILEQATLAQSAFGSGNQIGQDKSTNFFQLWTRKEAIFKLGEARNPQIIDLTCPQDIFGCVAIDYAGQVQINGCS